MVARQRVRAQCRGSRGRAGSGGVAIAGSVLVEGVEPGEEDAGPLRARPQRADALAKLAVSRHDSRGRASADSVCSDLDDGVVPVPGSVDDTHPTIACRSNAIAGTSLQHEDDASLRFGRDQAGVQARGRSRAVAPPLVGARADDVGAVDDEHRRRSASTLIHGTSRPCGPFAKPSVGQTPVA